MSPFFLIISEMYIRLLNHAKILPYESGTSIIFYYRGHLKVYDWLIQDRANNMLLWSLTHSVQSHSSLSNDVRIPKVSFSNLFLKVTQLGSIWFKRLLLVCFFKCVLVKLSIPNICYTPISYYSTGFYEMDTFISCKDWSSSLQNHSFYLSFRDRNCVYKGRWLLGCIIHSVYYLWFIFNLIHFILWRFLMQVSSIDFLLNELDGIGN